MKENKKFKVDWLSDGSAILEMGERLFVCDEVKEMDDEALDGDEDEIAEWLFEDGWSEIVKG